MLNTTGSSLAPSPPKQAPRPGGGGGRHKLKRSLSEFPSPVRLYRKDTGEQSAVPQSAHTRSQHIPHHRHHHHHHLHHHNHQHLSKVSSRLPHVSSDQDHKSNHHEKWANPATQALGYLRHSIDMPRSEAITPSITPAASRRPSIVAVPRINEDDKVSKDSGRLLRREKEQAEARNESLKQALQDMGAFSTTTIKRLDDTYYSVLEKTSALQSAIAALKELADSSREMCGTFDRDSQGLEHEIVTQLGNIGALSDQQSRIQGLRGRIAAGREKMDSLSKRGDLIKDKIEGWEQADHAWQSKTRKRLMWIWACSSVVFLVLIGVFLLARNKSPDLVDNVTSEVAKGIEHIKPDSFGDAVANLSREWLSLGNDEQDKLDTTLNWRTPTVDDEPLRILDEL